MKFCKTKRVSQRDIVVFFRQFATLISAGVPIINTCTILESTQKQALATVINRIKYDLLCGKTLSASLQRHPQHFDALIYQLIFISEQTGKLDTTLQMIAEHLEQKLLFREQIMRSLFYPYTVAIIGFVITLMMMIFIVPRFAELLNDFHGTIPLLSQCIFTCSAFIRQTLWGMPILIGAGYFLWQKKFKHLASKLPLIKDLTRQIQLARFIRHLGIAINAGIPLVNALNLAALPNQDPLLANTNQQLIRLVRSGIPLHRAMQSVGIFPSLLIQMSQTGAEAGQLDTMLLKTADLLEANIKQLLNRFSQLLEPLIMVILGVLIGGLVIGMYLPIFKLGSII